MLLLLGYVIIVVESLVEAMLWMDADESTCSKDIKRSSESRLLTSYSDSDSSGSRTVSFNCCRSQHWFNVILHDSTMDIPRSAWLSALHASTLE